MASFRIDYFEGKITIKQQFDTRLLRPTDKYSLMIATIQKDMDFPLILLHIYSTRAIITVTPDDVKVNFTIARGDFTRESPKIRDLYINLLDLLVYPLTMMLFEVCEPMYYISEFIPLLTDIINECSYVATSIYSNINEFVPPNA